MSESKPEADQSAAAPAPHRGPHPLDLEPIKAREKAATKGPWTSWQAGNSTMEDGLLDHIAEVKGLQRPWEPTWVGWAAAKNHFKSFFRQRDAEFVAHARADIPALIAEIERLRAAAAPAPATAWLLIETWRDKTEHIEGIALTDAAKAAFTRGHYELGHSRSALPYKVVAAPASPHQENGK